MAALIYFAPGRTLNRIDWAALSNIQISDQVTAPVIRQTIKRGHGNM
jgi:hypothetical protein